MSKKKVTLFAVYGSLKEGFSNHVVIQPSKKLGTFQTEPNYTMFGMGGYPAILLEGNTPITCEVYAVEDENVVNRVYGLEGYRPGSENRFYDMTQIPTPFGEANIFYFHNKPNNNIINSGIWERM